MPGAIAPSACVGNEVGKLRVGARFPPKAVVPLAGLAWVGVVCINGLSVVPTWAEFSLAAMVLVWARLPSVIAFIFRDFHRSSSIGNSTVNIGRWVAKARTIRKLAFWLPAAFSICFDWG